MAPVHVAGQEEVELATEFPQSHTMYWIDVGMLGLQGLQRCKQHLVVPRRGGEEGEGGRGRERRRGEGERGRGGRGEGEREMRTKD